MYKHTSPISYTPDLIKWEWAGDRSVSQPPPKLDDPATVPQTPPKEQTNNKTHSPITYNTSPRRPIKERLGERHPSGTSKAKVHHRDEAPQRTVKDRLGPRRRSRRKCRLTKSSRQDFASERKIWDHDQAGFWYPNQKEDTDELGNVSSDQEDK